MSPNGVGFDEEDVSSSKEKEKKNLDLLSLGECRKDEVDEEIR